MKTKILILIAIVLTMGACAKKKSANRSSRTTNPTTQVAPGTGSTTCAQNLWGRVFSQSLTGDQFTQGLIAFTGNSEIGFVDSSYYSTTTGVDLQMSAVFAGNQFNAAQSKILLRIFDSNAPSLGRLEDISLQGQAGQVLGAGAFQATYLDQYGTVTVRGQRDNSNMIYGQITFQNNSGTSGTLGEFHISNCALSGI